MTTNDLLALLRSRYKTVYTEAISLIEEVQLSSQNRPGFPKDIINALQDDLKSFALYNESGLASRGSINLQEVILAYAKQRKGSKKIGIKFELEEGNMTSELMRDSFTIHNCIPILIQRVVDQLLSNAYKYATPESEIKITRSIQGNSICFQNLGPTVEAEEINRLKEKGYRGVHTESVLGKGQGLWLVENAIVLHTQNIAPISFTLYSGETKFVKDAVPYADFIVKLCFDKYYFRESDRSVNLIQANGDIYFDSYIHDLWNLLERLHWSVKKLTMPFNEFIHLKILLEDLWMFADVMEYACLLTEKNNEIEIKGKNYFFQTEILLNPNQVFYKQLRNLIACKYPGVILSITGSLYSQIAIPSGFYRLLSGFLNLLLSNLSTNNVRLLITFDINIIEMEFGEENVDKYFFENLKISQSRFEGISGDNLEKYLPSLYIHFFEMVDCEIEIISEKIRLILPQQ